MASLLKKKNSNRGDLGDFEHSTLEELVRLDTRINQLEENMNNTLEHLSDVQSPDMPKLESRISDLEHLLSNIEMKLLKSGAHPNLEGNNDIEKKISSAENNPALLLKRVNDMEASRERGAESASVAQNPSSPVQNNSLRQEIEELKRELDSLKIRDKSIDTSVVRTEEKAREYLESINHKLDLKIIDIEEKLDKAFEDVPGRDHYEKNIELRIINMLSEKIEHFAQMLDKKLLEFPTRGEMERKLTRLEGAIAKVEHPNFRPLEERLGNLELKLDDLTNILNYHARRIPSVVE